MEKKGKDITTTPLTEKPAVRDVMEAEAFSKGLFMISEYSFDHVCYELSESQVNEQGLQFAYNLCRDFLRLKTRPEVGLTVIVSPKWIFVGVMTQPYCFSAHGYPVYLDGFSFAGLVSLQNPVPEWPATAGLVNKSPTVFGALASSTFLRSVITDENPMTERI